MALWGKRSEEGQPHGPSQMRRRERRAAERAERVSLQKAAAEEVSALKAAEKVIVAKAAEEVATKELAVKEVAATKATEEVISTLEVMVEGKATTSCHGHSSCW